MECCHGPGGKADNSLANISWGSKAKNHGADRRRDGTIPRGERNGRAKLTEAQVTEIRALYASEVGGPRFGRTWTHRSLAERFGVDRGTIEGIIRGKTWVHPAA
jgi:hypothetical protein